MVTSHRQRLLTGLPNAFACLPLGIRRGIQKAGWGCMLLRQSAVLQSMRVLVPVHASETVARPVALLGKKSCCFPMPTANSRAEAFVSDPTVPVAPCWHLLPPGLLTGLVQLVSKGASWKAPFRLHSRILVAPLKHLAIARTWQGMEKSHLRIPGWRRCSALSKATAWVETAGCIPDDLSGFCIAFVCLQSVQLPLVLRVSTGAGMHMVCTCSQAFGQLLCEQKVTRRIQRSRNHNEPPSVA